MSSNTCTPINEKHKQVSSILIAERTVNLAFLLPILKLYNHRGENA